VVLCYLEGRTHEEAAALLCWPVGTVKGRLSRARDLLRDRLTRRGLTVPAGLVAAILAEEARAAVPAALLQSTVAAATGIAAGKAVAAGLVSATAIALAEGVIQSMFATKLKMMVLGLIAAGVVAGGAGAFAFQRAARATARPRPGECQEEGGGAGARVPADDVALAKARANLVKIRLEAARRQLARTKQRYERGTVSPGSSSRPRGRSWKPNATRMSPTPSGSPAWKNTSPRRMTILRVQRP